MKINLTNLFEAVLDTGGSCFLTLFEADHPHAVEQLVDWGRIRHVEVKSDEHTYPDGLQVSTVRAEGPRFTITVHRDREKP